MNDLPLTGRVALVTGVSRRAGIGYATAARLAAAGATLFLHHHAPHDTTQPWGADPSGPEAIAAELGAGHLGLDLVELGAPERLMAAVPGHVDILVCNHARSGGDGPLGELDAAMLDAHWAVNTRSTLLLVQAFAAQHDGRGGGRVVLMTSGQDLGPMTGEIAYAASKAALSGITRTLADALAGRGITVNAVNPGPVDTGWASAELLERVRPAFPAGRWGRPDDAARLIGWLVSGDAEWVTGQVINSEGGFRR
ncbi:SDR family oxidoreductase [Actinokineospora globicatena]|uniref:3-ketoacyl-ACP reductase n=1 Tax=Actinokineospora globicatena TaxID=103729 RepID=A0A9W6QLE0_9PSEU|nr:SDR family oxidoreductase [Actinokineospora globicatena]GLW91737.1 3-ketoacyl-ACP reductase [Actinokineospora globicatena]